MKYLIVLSALFAFSSAFANEGHVAQPMNQDNSAATTEQRGKSVIKQKKATDEDQEAKKEAEEKAKEQR